MQVIYGTAWGYAQTNKLVQYGCWKYYINGDDLNHLRYSDDMVLMPHCTYNAIEILEIDRNCGVKNHNFNNPIYDKPCSKSVSPDN